MARECGSACPTTCDNYNTTVICTEQCVPGCFCPPGTVELSGVCVDPSQCTNSMYLQYMASLIKWWLLEATCTVYVKKNTTNAPWRHRLAQRTVHRAYPSVCAAL